MRHTHPNTLCLHYDASRLATIEDVRTAEIEEEVEEPVSNGIDNDTLEDREEKEVD